MERFVRGNSLKSLDKEIATLSLEYWKELILEEKIQLQETLAMTDRVVRDDLVSSLRASAENITSTNKNIKSQKTNSERSNLQGKPKRERLPRLLPFASR